MASGDRAGAADAIAPAASDSASTDTATLAIAIEALALEGKADEARLLLDRLARAEPDAAPTVACRALVLKAEGDVEAATSTLLDAASAAENAPDGEAVNRFYFEQLGRIAGEAATEQFGRKMVARWPGQGAALGRFLAGAGRIDEALDACRVAIDAGNLREPVRIVLALYGSNKLEGPLLAKGIELAIKAPLREPRNADVLAMTAGFLRKTRRFDDEAAFYVKILAAEPLNVVARNNLAWVLGNDLNKPAEALVEVNKVIAQVGPIPQATDTRGMILGKLGRVADAIADLEQATRADPSALHHIHLARAYALAGKDDLRQKSLAVARLAGARPGDLEPDDLAEFEAANPR